MARKNPQESAKDTDTQEGETALLVCDITRLEIAQGLPEVGDDVELEPIDFADGAIEQFVAAGNQDRVMRVVGFAGGLAAQAVKPAGETAYQPE